MKKINVIDLDNTLLPYDSFGKLVKKEIKKLDLFVYYVSFLRVLRIMSGHKFKQVLTTRWEHKYDQSFFDNYAETIYNDIDKRVLEIVNAKTNSNTVNILLSASPHLYVKKIIELLKWTGSGSYFEENKFINLYSKEKIHWLTRNYPNSEFDYNFAVSDSHSDDQLLALFEESIFWEKKSTS